MIEDYFRFAIKGIMNKGVRSWLTMIGIFIGIAAVVSLISLGEGMKNAINEQFEIFGGNVVYITPGMALGISPGASKLTEHDFNLIKRVHGVDIASGVLSRGAKVKFRDDVGYTFVIGIMTDDSQDLFIKQGGMNVEKGQKRFKPDDKYKVAIGYLIEKGDFFDKPVSVGNKLEINDREFDVTATMSKIGNPQDDTQMYIPIDIARELFGVKDEYTAILAKTKGGFDTTDVAEDIKEKLRRDRNLKKGEEDFQVMTTEQLRESVGFILDAVQIVLVGIAAISLLVGGVGIMNTMYTSVIERTNEIGIMKAIGARNSDVMIIFLFESGTLGLVGGVIGCIFGIGLSKTVEYIAISQGYEILKASVSIELILGSLLFSFILGCISGVLPARQASNLKPVDALRYE